MEHKPMRLIDAEEAKKNCERITNPYAVMAAKAQIDSTETIDAVPVVRCKECSCFMEYTAEYKQNVEGADGDCFIRLMNSDDKQFCARKFTDYCSDGKPRDAKTNADPAEAKKVEHEA